MPHDHEYDPTLQSPAERRSLLSQGILRLRRLFVQIANIVTLRTDTITERTSGAGVTIDLTAGNFKIVEGGTARAEFLRTQNTLIMGTFGGGGGNSSLVLMGEEATIFFGDAFARFGLIPGTNDTVGTRTGTSFRVAGNIIEDFNGVAAIKFLGTGEVQIPGGLSITRALSFDDTEVTIAAGSITLSRVFHRIDTQDDDPSDDLDTIVSLASGDAHLLYLTPAHTDRTIVIKHNTGNIRCVDGVDLVMDSTDDWAILVFEPVADVWLCMTTALSNIPTQEAPLAMGTNPITGVVDPSDDQDAATKKYVDDNKYADADAISAVEGEATLLLAGNVSVAKSFSLSGDISPAQLSANTNNWDPTGLADASVIRVSTDASRDLTGIVPKSPDDGRLLIIHNIGAQNLVLKDASGSSTAANRFALSGDITLAGDDAVTLQYDTTTNRWRAIGSSPGGAGGGGAHGPGDHTSFANWKVIYTDGSGDQQELALGAAGTLVQSAGAAAAPTMVDNTHLIYVGFDPDPTDASNAKVSYGPMPWAGEFVKVHAKTIPNETVGAASQIVDIHLQTEANDDTDTASTIFGTRPTVTNKHNSTTTFVSSPKTFAKGDWLYFFSDQLGTGISWIEVGIEVKRTA